MLMLPREVRDEIYTLILSSRATPPAFPADAGPRYSETVSLGRNVLYPVPSPINDPSSALSQCCRQLRQELRELKGNRHLTNGITYRLDAMLQRCRLWLTWTNFPFPAMEMGHLEVNLRLFDIKSGGGLFWGDGGPGRNFIVLFRALDRLLHHGPHFLYNRKSEQGMKIGTLTINVLFGYGKAARPTKVDTEAKCKQYDERVRRRIFRSIHWNLSRVVDCGLLSEKVQTLRVCDGDVVKEYSTAGIPPSTRPPETWQDYGFAWGMDKDMTYHHVDSRVFCLPQKEIEKTEET